MLHTYLYLSEETNCSCCGKNFTEGFFFHREDQVPEEGEYERFVCESCALDKNLTDPETGERKSI